MPFACNYANEPCGIGCLKSIDEEIGEIKLMYGGGPISNRPKTNNSAVGVYINASIPISVR